MECDKDVYSQQITTTTDETRDMIEILYELNRLPLAILSMNALILESLKKFTTERDAERDTGNDEENIETLAKINDINMIRLRLCVPVCHVELPLIVSHSRLLLDSADHSMFIWTPKIF